MQQPTTFDDFTHYDRDELTRLLGLPHLPPAKARDGIVSCFINIKSAQLQRGAQLLNRDSSPEAIQRYGYYLARSIFARLSIPYNTPTEAQLAQVVAEMNKAWEFSVVDDDLRHIHDQICGELVKRVTA